MGRLGDFSAGLRRDVRFVFTDIDDTLTLDGRLPGTAFAATSAAGSATTTS